MTERVVSLNDVRNRRSEAADNGSEMRCFLARYTMNGEEWGFEVWATDEADAAKRLRAICETAELDGSVRDGGIE